MNAQIKKSRASFNSSINKEATGKVNFNQNLMGFVEHQQARNGLN